MTLQPGLQLDASPTSAPRNLSRLQRHAQEGSTVGWCKLDGTVEKTKITELYVSESLDRIDADEAGPGEIAAVAGMAEITIGETLADPDQPSPSRHHGRRAEPDHDDRHQHVAPRRTEVRSSRRVWSRAASTRS